MAEAASQNRDFKALAAEYGQKYGILMALILVCVLLTFANEYFLTTRNILNVLRQTSINGILAIGMTFVILTRGIDLSVGSVVALAGVVSASLATTSTTAAVLGAPYFAAIPLAAGVAVGLACGWVNGVIVARFNVPAFVTTLGMLSAARGMTLLYTGGKPVPALTDGFRYIGTGSILGIPMPIILFAVIFLAALFVLSATRFGRTVYAVGGNPHAARVSGINIRRVRLTVYVISGALAGIAGMILAARTGSALTQAGIAYELDAIAAVVIGGTSLSGGVGKVTGTLIGALLIAVVNNGLDLMGVESYYQQVIKGALIVAAVMLDQARHKAE
ncbi:ABC transporter permease [Aliiruegeria lutimaris]|uniref:Monosaccharide ABC transporter membrane protein, CUT2 family n=1 Tax=Aliiruegeria lutimaris TaxID=571298 RepID=A0A1G8T5D5_9RHOB|nr:ABC transporter permease [Aliiruegeria lutimaris]SDJ36624.1 monosaccharide ABC transporter membrane protein, CUT2 family [Aliiruegeria lutimaris]